MAGTISNPRDLLVELLGELLHVERRLAGEVLASLADAVADEALRDFLRRHLEETREHVDRVETAFRRLELAPSAHLSRPFESAVRQHEQGAAKVVEPALADAFHAQAALHTEHWEIAAYTAVLAAGHASEHAGALEPLLDSLAEEERARAGLEQLLGRLTGA